MGKNVSLEIATPMTACEPSAIVDGINGVNKRLVKKLGTKGGWVTDHETQRAQRSDPILIRPVTDYRYIHYARSTSKVGLTSAPFEIINFITQEDPNFRLPGNTQEDDLPTRIRRKMKEVIGRCTLEGMLHRFDDIEIVDPIKDKHEKHKVVLLRQLSHATHEESVSALDLISNEVNERVSSRYPLVNQIGDVTSDEEDTVTVERGIPIASVYLHDPSKQEFDPDVLNYIKKGIFDHLITPTCDFVSSDIDISHES